VAPNLNSRSSRSCARPEGVVRSVPTAGWLAAIDAWRAHCADRFEPVRFRLIEAMARRAQACSGTARALLDEKVATLLAAHVEAFEQAQTAELAKPPAPPSRGPLAALLDHIAQQSSPMAGGPAQGHSADAPVELKAVQQFRSTWTKLRADQRLTQSQAQVPQNAGPLNSQRLVHRSLARMNELSPAYLAQFISYADALMWLDDVAGQVPGPAKRTRARAR